MSESTKASPSEAGNSSKDVQARENGGLKENVDKRNLNNKEEADSTGEDRKKNLSYDKTKKEN